MHDTPLEVGSRFSMREGSKTIGTGLGQSHFLPFHPFQG